MDTQLDLEPGRALSLPTPGRYTLQVRAGRVWVTRSGDLTDHFLGAGDRLGLDDADRVVIESDGHGPARLLLAPAGSWWRRALTGALLRLRRPASALPEELLELDEHALQDIGAPAHVRRAARDYRAWQGLRGLQFRLAAVGR